jgi:hypothetical protein
MSASEKEHVAYEAGHALVALSVKHAVVMLGGRAAEADAPA